MVFTGAEYPIEDLFEELKALAWQENISTLNDYKELVEYLIEERYSYGFFDDNDYLDQIIDNLAARWPEIQKFIADKTGKPMV